MLYLEKLRDRDTTGPSKDFIQENRVIIKNYIMTKYISSSFLKLASGDFCYLLIAFANSLDPDQDRQNVRPDLVPNCLQNLNGSKLFETSDCAPERIF